jgi:deoxyribodipyrimidine photolyase
MAANGAAKGGSGGRAVLWFRNDLRLHDNGIVAEAARRAESGQIEEVLLALVSFQSIDARLQTRRMDSSSLRLQ